MCDSSQLELCIFRQPCACSVPIGRWCVVYRKRKRQRAVERLQYFAKASFSRWQCHSDLTIQVRISHLRAAAQAAHPQLHSRSASRLASLSTPAIPPVRSRSPPGAALHQLAAAPARRAQSPPCHAQTRLRVCPCTCTLQSEESTVQTSLFTHQRDQHGRTVSPLCTRRRSELGGGLFGSHGQ